MICKTIELVESIVFAQNNFSREQPETTNKPTSMVNA